MVGRSDLRGMTDAWQAYIDLALGVTETSRKRATKVVKQLVGKGNATSNQLQTMAEDLVNTGLANREAMVRLIRFELDRTLGRVGLATAEEVAELTGRVRDLEQQLTTAQAQLADVGAPAPAAAPAPTTGPATHKPAGATATAGAPQLVPTENATSPSPIAKKAVAKKAVKKATPAPAAPVPTAVAKKAVAKKAVAKRAVAKAPAKTAAKQAVPARAAAKQAVSAKATPARKTAGTTR